MEKPPTPVLPPRPLPAPAAVCVVCGLQYAGHACPACESNAS